MSVGNDLLRAVMARLTGPTPVVARDSVRRWHRTTVTRTQAPAVHLVEGTDTPKGDIDKCTVPRELDFVLRIFVRADDPEDAADRLKEQVLDRLDPESTAYAAYPHNGRLSAGRITPDQEVADQDALGIDMEFKFSYDVGRWSLTTPA